MNYPNPKNDQDPGGQRAAFFPALSEGSKEKRAVSILLACIEHVPELARALLSRHGVPIGKRARLQAWTEVGGTGERDSARPDGRIVVESTHKQQWVALLEAKIAKADLDDQQIDAYLKLGKATNANAVITISNDFTVLPTHHPTYRGRIPKGMTLLHWSWCSILTECRLMINGDDINDPNHHWIIEHLVRFLGHPSAGVTRFDRMPAEWRNVTDAVSTGAGVRKGDKAAQAVAAGWIQESRDLGLQLTELLDSPVSMKIDRTEQKNQKEFINRIVEQLCADEMLGVEYRIPDSVSNLKVQVDLKGKTLTSSMTVGAPEDRKTAKSRVTWLLRQLTKTPEENIHIRAVYGRRGDLQEPLSRVREDPAILTKDQSTICPRRFEVKLISNLGRKMGGPKTVIQELEVHVPRFYREVGQYLRAWVPRPPKVHASREMETPRAGAVSTVTPPEEREVPEVPGAPISGEKE